MCGSRGGDGGSGPPLENYKNIWFLSNTSPDPLKGMYYCPIEIIKGLTDKGQIQYLTKLKGPQVGNYLYTTRFLSLR